MPVLSPHILEELLLDARIAMERHRPIGLVGLLPAVVHAQVLLALPPADHAAGTAADRSQVRRGHSYHPGYVAEQGHR